VKDRIGAIYDEIVCVSNEDAFAAARSAARKCRELLAMIIPFGERYLGTALFADLAG
jgi:hypothetical protein